MKKINHVTQRAQLNEHHKNRAVAITWPPGAALTQQCSPFTPEQFAFGVWSHNTLLK